MVSKRLSLLVTQKNLAETLQQSQIVLIVLIVLIVQQKYVSSTELSMISMWPIVAIFCNTLSETKRNMMIIFEESLYLFKESLHLPEERLKSWQLKTCMTKLND